MTHNDGESLRLEVRVLGAIEVRVDATAVPLGHQQEILLAILTVNRGEIVCADRLVEELWGDRLPSDPNGALRSIVARLRKGLGAAASRLVTGPTGYRLCVDRDEVDAACFEDRASAGIAAGAKGLALLDDALALWRGSAYAGVADRDTICAAAVALEDRRLDVRERRAAALVSLGRSAEAIADLEAMLTAHPQREYVRALLMEALADVGRPTDALAAYHRWSDELAERGLDPSPRLRAAETEVVRHVRAAAVPRWRSLLPVPVSSFIGRDAEVAAVCSLIDNDRLITLVGVGGVGKTRLALAVAERLGAGFPGGVWFCDLAPATTAPEAVDIVATTIGVAEQSGDPLVAQLARRMHGARCLVVLDNCERVTSGATEVAEALTTRTSSVVVLATSRQRLGADGERAVKIQPLPVVGHDSAAAQLFTERCTALGIGPSAPTSAERDVIEQLCRRLEGLPLAIELAAARTTGITVIELEIQVRRRLDMLVDRQRTPARHRSLTALIDWSHDDLDDITRAAFRRLGVFRASFTLAAATELLAATGHAPTDVPDVLVELVDRSLLHRTTESDGSRYRALDSIREYMLDRLERAGETALTTAAHARWAAGLAELAEPALAGPDEASWAAIVYQQLDDFRAAVDWSIDTGGDEALRIVAALHFFALWRSESEIYRWAERAIRNPPTTDCQALPAAFAAAASGAWQRGDLDTAKQTLAAGLKVATRYEVALSRRLIEVAGDIALLTGDLAEAVARFGESRDLAVAEGDQAQAVWDEGSRALAHAYGADSSATSVAEHAHRLAEAAGSPSATSFAHFALAETLLATDPHRARRHLVLAGAAADVTASTYLAALVRLSATSLTATTANPSYAMEQFERLLSTWPATGSGTGLAVSIRSLVTALTDLGVLEGAALLHGAVTNPQIGPVPYGEDAARLATAERTLRDRLGPRFNEITAIGHSLDEQQLASEALHLVRTAHQTTTPNEPSLLRQG